MLEAEESTPILQTVRKQRKLSRAKEIGSGTLDNHEQIKTNVNQITTTITRSRCRKAAGNSEWSSTTKTKIDY